MSQRVVRYEGEGRGRRPVYADEGPSAASTVDGLASLGRLSVFAPGDGDVDRSIERRQITAAEIAARAREPKPDAQLTKRAPVTTDAARTHASRMRGAEANRARIAASKPSPKEGSAVVTPAQVPAQPDSALLALAQTATEAASAFEAHSAAQERWEAARRALVEAWEFAGILTDAELIDAAAAAIDRTEGEIEALVPGLILDRQPAPEPDPDGALTKAIDVTPSRPTGGGSKRSPVAAADARRPARDERRPRGGRGEARLQADVARGIPRSYPQARRPDRPGAGRPQRTAGLT